MRKFVGITIGPIYDTIMDASSQAALWFASSMFSDITRRICVELKGENGFADAVIYSPYFEAEQKQTDGVGKYHDRIFFSTESDDIHRLEALLQKVKEETVSVLGLRDEDTYAADKQFFKEYLQINYVVVEEEKLKASNCILNISPYLDALELMKTFPASDIGNPIKRQFLHNMHIEKSVLFEQIEKEKNQFVVYKNGKKRFRKIDEIAGSGVESEFKKSKYFAVVSADADGMGRFLEKLSNEDVQLFSKCCLDYASKSAEKIDEFNGMTVYAGGDDLLFLAPVEAGEKNVFDLCHEIQQVIKECIAEFADKKSENLLPTISFGISIQYVKFPLYEALDNAQRLLRLAKKDAAFGDNAKNKDNMVIGLQKHSGQSVLLQLGNECYDDLKTFLGITGSSTTSEQVNSIIYILESFRSIIHKLNQEAFAEKITYERYETAWGNLFDNVNQQAAQGYIKAICKQYYEVLMMNARMMVPDVVQETGVTDTSFMALLNILRIKKFLEEKGAEE